MKTPMIDWTDVIDLIRKNDQISLYMHTTPDGDTLGSTLALSLSLQRMGKQTEIICDQPVPEVYSFLSGTENVATSQTAHAYPAAISIDCADESRMGNCFPCFQKALMTVNIDHHETNTRYAQINVVDPDAAAVGELIYLLLDSMHAVMSSDVCEALLTALSTDSGHFAYSNTTPRTLEIAGQLLSFGNLDMSVLNRKLYHMLPYKQLQLRAYVLSRIELAGNEKIGLGYVFLDEMQRFETLGEHAEGIIDFIRDIDTVEVAIFIRQVKSGNFKVSFRSKTTVDVSKLAAKFGGGGHARAAGCTLPGPFEAVHDEVLKLTLSIMETIQ